MPPVFKKNYTTGELFSVLNEDFSTELKDFPINFASIPVNELISTKNRPQEIFEQRVLKKDAKLSMFELNWESEITMESVVRVLKAIPTNFQSTFNYELAGMVVSNGGYYTGISKSNENWRILGEFLNGSPVSWIKVAWFLISSIKFPVIFIYNRVDGYQSSLNFLSSVECEKLSQFAARQDRCFKIHIKRSEGPKDDPGYSQSFGLKPNNQGVKPRQNFDSDNKSINLYEQGVKSRPYYEQSNRFQAGNKSKTLQYESHDVDDLTAASRNRIELLEAKLRSPGSNSSNLPAEKGNNEVFKDSGLRPRNEEMRQSGYLQNSQNWRDERKWGSIKDELRVKNEEGYESNGIKQSYTPDKLGMRGENLKKTDFELGENNELMNRQRFSSVERPAGRSTYLKNEGVRKDLRYKNEGFSKDLGYKHEGFRKDLEYKNEYSDSGFAEKTIFRAKMQDQYQNFKDKYRFLEEPEGNPNPIKPEFSPNEIIKNDYSGKFMKNNYPEAEKEQKRPLYYPTIDSKSTENLPVPKVETDANQFKVNYSRNPDEKTYYRPSERSRAALRNPKPADDYPLNRSIDREEWSRYKTEKFIQKVEIPPSKYIPETHEERPNFKPSETYFPNFKDPEPINHNNLNRSIDNEEWRKVEKAKHYSVERHEKSSSGFTKYSQHLNNSKDLSLIKGANEPSRKKILSSDFSLNAELNFDRSSNKGQDNEWNCTRCGKMLSMLAYECTECRLINWDQFYRVKSIQQPGKSEYRPEVQFSGFESSKSGNKVSDEDGDWVCAACYNTNKGLFFLCKNCRKPKGYADLNKVSKEYN